MTNLLTCGLLAGLVFALSLSMAAPADKADDGPKVVHNVFFSLKDNSIEAKKKLVDSCKGYLAKQPGIAFFAAGTLAEDFKREVNDRDFDVGLHIVFKDKAAHDKYQDADDHKKFIEENKGNWKKVRVFDSLVD
jgi:Stress responsive A/B Barrel Domain